jgi:hypothetical protein
MTAPLNFRALLGIFVNCLDEFAMSLGLLEKIGGILWAIEEMSLHRLLVYY